MRSKYKDEHKTELPMSLIVSSSLSRGIVKIVSN